MNRWLMIAVLAAGCGAGAPLAAQEQYAELEGGEGTAKESTPTVIYSVRITEYEITKALPPTATQEDMLAVIEQAEGDVLSAVQTLGCTVVSDLKSQIQFGRRIALESGVAVRGNQQRIVQTRDQDVGTIVTLLARPKGDRTMMTIAYESSRPQPTDREVSPTDITTLQCEVSLLVAAGQPVLMASQTTEGKTTCLVLQVDPRN